MIFLIAVLVIVNYAIYTMRSWEREKQSIERKADLIRQRNNLELDKIRCYTRKEGRMVDITDEVKLNEHCVGARSFFRMGFRWTYVPEFKM